MGLNSISRIVCGLYTTGTRAENCFPEKYEEKMKCSCCFRSLILPQQEIPKKAPGARGIRATPAFCAQQTLSFLPNPAALELLHSDGSQPLRFKKGGISSVLCTISAGAARGGQGISSRQEAETGNRGPVIEAICFNKAMLLVVKQRFCWRKKRVARSPAPFPEVQCIYNLKGIYDCAEVLGTQ